MYVFRLRDVRLRLVVVVVGDEVLDRVVGQHLAQLVGELRGERLFGSMTSIGRWSCLPDPGDGGGLAGAGRAEQHRVVVAGLDPPGDLSDRLRLVAGWHHVGNDLERCHLRCRSVTRTHELNLLDPPRVQL